MSPDRPTPAGRQAVALCALAVALLLTGCIGALNDTPDLPDGDEAVERLSSVDVYNETVTVESTADNETTEFRIERTARPATGEQYQVVYRDGNQTVTVSNGTTTWVYRPAVNEVTRFQTNGVRITNQTAQVRELVDSLDTGDGSGPSIFPIGPSLSPDSTAQGLYNATAFGPDSLRTEYRGVETVSGRETYVIRIASTESADQELQQTLYFDTETFVVMRQEYNATIAGERIEDQRRVQNITFDPAVDESLFEFDPPDNTTIRTSIEQYGSYAELERAADGHVPEPSVPTGFEFDIGSLTDDTVSLQYTRPPDGLSVSRSTAVEIDNGLERVDYRGRTYSVRERTETTTVQWRCNTSVYTVGGDLSRDTLLEVADSIECPTN